MALDSLNWNRAGARKNLSCRKERAYAVEQLTVGKALNVKLEIRIDRINVTKSFRGYVSQKGDRNRRVKRRDKWKTLMNTLNPWIDQLRYRAMRT